MAEPSPRQTLVIDPSPIKHDETLFTSLNVVSEDIPEAYQELYLSDTVKEQAEAEFLAADCNINPDLTAKQLDNDTLTQRETRLRQLKKEIIKGGGNPEVVQAYRWRINEMIGSIHMLQASARGDMRSFERWNRYVYGDPSQEVFAATSDWFCIGAEQFQADPAVAPEVATVLEALGPERGSVDAILPSAGVFTSVRDNHFEEGGFYNLLLADADLPEGKVTKVEGDPVLRRAMDAIGGEEYDIVDSPDSTWRLRHDTKQVERPAGHKLPTVRYIGLPLGHEVGSHLLEAINGGRSSLQLSAAGLDRYELGNEGRAVMREQIAFEDFEAFSRHIRWNDILRRHLAVSLGAGMTGEQMDFKAVYKIVNAIDVLREYAKDPLADLESVRQKAHSRTWSLLTRVLKGTDGEGGAFYKDKVYLEGNVACWLAAEADPENINLGDRGKFDITNPRHIALLQKLGVLPSEE